MFARVFALLPLAALVVADDYVTQCNTGSSYCCNSYGSQSNTPAIASYVASSGIGGLLGSLGVSVDALLALECTGIAGVGSSCDQQPVCCENNKQVGLVNIGCTPIKVL